MKSDFAYHTEAGKQPYLEALTSWMQYHEYRCNYATDPSDADAQNEAARLYKVALERTKAVLGIGKSRGDTHNK